MKHTLYDRPTKRVIFEGKKIRLRTGFQQVLRYYSVLRDEDLSDMDKVDIGLWLFLRNRLRLRIMPPAKKISLMEAIFEQYIGAEKQATNQKCMDFDQDSAYIFAAFYQCYHIDLLGKDKKLHWHKFIDLLGGLSDDTRFMQIISIRTRPIPKATKYNAQERAALARLKAQYRVKLTDSEQRQQRENGFAKIAQMLEAQTRCKK